MGMTHGNDQDVSAPGPADLLRPGRLRSLATAEAVVKLFRDHGNRADRKRARIKYVVHDWGVAQVPRGAGRIPRRPAGAAARRSR